MKSTPAPAPASAASTAVAATPPAAPAPRLQELRFGLLGVPGDIEFDVPAAWTPMNGPGSTLIFAPPGERALQLVVTLVDADAASFGSLPEAVQAAARKTPSMFQETEIYMHDLRCAGGEGYYVPLTRKDPAPGEYEHVRQGMARFGRFLVTFTLSSHEAESPDIDAGLNVIANAKLRTQ